MSLTSTGYTDRLYPVEGIKRVDTPVGRFYQVPGPSGLPVKYPSASTVVGMIDKGYIKEWIARVGQERAGVIKDRAAFRGSHLHLMAENYLLQKDPYDIGEILPPMPKFMFKKMMPALQKITNLRALELTVFSHKYGIAGTLDVQADYEGEPSIIDFKTMKRETSPEKIRGYFAQTGIYAQSVEELYSIRVKRSVIIAVTETGKLQVFKEDPFDPATVADIIKARELYINDLREQAKRKV